MLGALGSRRDIQGRLVTLPATRTSIPLSQRRIGAGSESILLAISSYTSIHRLICASFAPAEEIGQYFISVVQKHDIYPLITFDSQVVGARWDDATSKWHIQISRPRLTENEENGSSTRQYEADIFINAGGILNDWKWPDIPGLRSFGGKLLHTAAWVRR